MGNLSICDLRTVLTWFASHMLAFCLPDSKTAVKAQPQETEAHVASSESVGSPGR